MILICCPGLVVAKLDARQASSDTPAALQPAGYAEPIPDDIWLNMQGRSWHSELACPARTDLSLLHVPFIDFEGRSHIGRMIVAGTVASDVLSVFAELYSKKFPIESMELVDAFGGDDLKSMEANNSSAFNCRAVSGSPMLSEHAKGLAIDINPALNPYVSAFKIQPAAGKAYSTAENRSASRPGLIAPGDVVITAFQRIGWKWGGFWSNAKDYQHFSQSGK